MEFIVDKTPLLSNHLFAWKTGREVIFTALFPVRFRQYSQHLYRRAGVARSDSVTSSHALGNPVVNNCLSRSYNS